MLPLATKQNGASLLTEWYLRSFSYSPSMTLEAIDSKSELSIEPISESTLSELTLEMAICSISEPRRSEELSDNMLGAGSLEDKMAWFVGFR